MTIIQQRQYGQIAILGLFINTRVLNNYSDLY